MIESNQLKNVLRGDNIGYLPTLTGANQSAAGDFISTDNNASPRLGVLLRYHGCPELTIACTGSGPAGTSQLRISKFFNGAETILKSIRYRWPRGRDDRSIWSEVSSATDPDAHHSHPIGQQIGHCRRHDVRHRNASACCQLGPTVGPHIGGRLLRVYRGDVPLIAAARTG